MSVPQPRLRGAAVCATISFLSCQLVLTDLAVAAPQGASKSVPLPLYDASEDGRKPSTNGRVYAFSSGPVERPIRQTSHSQFSTTVPPIPIPAEQIIHDGSPVYYDQPASTQYFSEPVYRPLYRQQEQLRHRWFSAEALLWWTSSVDMPVLATTSPQGTPANEAGVLGQNTSVLLGGGDIFGFAQGGVRLRAGKWFDKDDGSGILAEFFILGSRGENYSAVSNGDPILARPFFNAGPGNNFQDSQLIAYPGLASGSLRFNAETRMYSVGLQYWEEIYDSRCGCNTCGDCCGVPCGNSCGDVCSASCGDGCGGGCLFEQRRNRDDTTIGIILGPRFTHLDDTLSVRERLTSVATGSQFDLSDSFKTENSFLGGEIGVRARRRRGDFTFDLGLQLAIGATHQELDINGRNTITTNGVPTSSAGGFLAQQSNIGNYDRNRFSLIPALDLKVAYETRKGWRFSVGYNLMYWTNVLRAAEQIDTVVNEDYFAPANLPSLGASRPTPLFRESDYLAHGLTFGIEKRY